MRVVVLLIAVILIVAGFFWFSYQDPAAERSRLTAAAENATALIGVQRMLRRESVYAFTNVVISRNPDGQGFEFRALSVRQGVARPVYGQVKSLCAQRSDTAECWEIGLLEIDGRTYIEDGTRTVPAAESTAGGSVAPYAGGQDSQNTNVAVTPEPSVVQPTVNLEQKEPVVPASAPAQPEATSTGELQSAQSIGPSPTHRVDRPVVNARSGPGTENPVVTTLLGGTELAQIDETGGWGQFMVLSGDAKGEVVWISLNIVIPVES